MSLFVSVNRAIINKIESKDSKLWKNFSDDFENVEITVEELAEVINEGYSVCAQHNGKRKHENFIKTNMLWVDIDNNLTIDEALDHPFVKKCATVFYTTPSHTLANHRFRLGFQLERAITDAYEMRNALTGLIRKFGGDQSCSDACRGFFGSKGSNPVILNGVMSESVLNELINEGSNKRFSAELDSTGMDTSRTITPQLSKIYLNEDQIVKTAKPEGFALLKTLARGTSIYCPIHIDNNPSALAVISQEDVHGVHCRKCYSTFWPKSKKEKKIFDFHTFEKYVLTEKYSKNLPNDEGYIQEEVYKSLTPRVVTMEIVNEKYLHLRTPLYDGVTFVKSPKGTGKTEWLAEVVRRCRVERKSVLLIGHRQSLIQSISKRLGLTCYFEIEEDCKKNISQSDYYAVCADSVHRLLNTEYKTYDVVILDESEQVLSHLTGNTLKNKRRITYEKIFFYLRSAKSIILTDADLDMVTVSTIKEAVSKGTGFHFLLNTYKAENKSLKVFNHEGQLRHSLLKHIGLNEKCYVSTNSKKKADEIYAAIREKFSDNKKIILVSSETCRSGEVSALLADLNKKILDYDVVIATPTLGSGVDINIINNGKLFSVYGFFVSRVNTHFDIDQQLSRVRNPNSTKVYISPAIFNFESDFNVIREEAKINTQLNDMINGYSPIGKPEIQENYLNLYGHVTSMSRASKNQFKRNYIHYKRSSGYEVIELERPSKQELSNINSSGNAEFKEFIHKIRVRRLVEARKLCQEEYTDLLNQKKYKRLDVVDLNALERFEIEDFYKMDVCEKIISLEENEKFSEKIQMLENYLLPLDVVKKKDIRDMKSLSFYPDRGNFTLKKIMIKDLLSSALLANEEMAFDASVIIDQKKLSKFVKLCQAKCEQIQALFDVNVLPRDLSKKPVQTLNKILNLLGQKLLIHKRQRSQFGTKNIYKIDSEIFRFSLEVIEKRHDLNLINFKLSGDEDGVSHSSIKKMESDWRASLTMPNDNVSSFAQLESNIDSNTCIAEEFDAERELECAWSRMETRLERKGEEYGEEYDLHML